MNAQERFKKQYRKYRHYMNQGMVGTAMDILERGRRYRREAALERQIAAQQRQHESDQRRIETLQEIYRSDHDERIRQEECIKQLQSEIDYLRSTDHAVDMAMERQYERREQLDSWSDETPLGMALDGLCDEVE